MIATANSSLEWDKFSWMIIHFFEPLVIWFGKLSILGDATYIKVLGAADPLLSPYAEAAGFELSVFKFLIALFAVYPFSALLYHLPTPTAKHLCSFFVGFLIVQWIFAADWIHTFISSIGTYLICALFPKQYIGVGGFFWVMGYLIICHIYTMQVRYLSEEFDFLRTQMVITMKLTSFAYNLYDGTTDYERVFVTKHSEKNQKVFTARRRFAITALPSLLEFLGYVYCFPCILVGPAFEYNDYIRPITGEAFLLSSTEVNKDIPQESRLKKPSTLLPALQRLFVGLFFMGLYLYWIPSYDIAQHYQPTFIANTTLFQRLYLLLLALWVQRFKFFFAWKVAEGGSILGGFGFEGYTMEGLEKGWKGAENVNIIGLECSSNVQSVTRHWNKRTQGWLERYTYLRTGRSLVATYLVSAIWHGLYPGYFFAFLTLPLPTHIERLMKQKINPWLVPGYNGYDPKTYPNSILGKIYEGICWIGTWMAMAYSMQVFYMISAERSLTCWKGYYFLGHWMMGIIYLGLSLVPTPTTGLSRKKAEQSTVSNKDEMNPFVASEKSSTTTSTRMKTD